MNEAIAEAKWINDYANAVSNSFVLRKKSKRLLELLTEEQSRLQSSSKR